METILYRVEKSRTERVEIEGGTGLGLAIIKKIADSQGWNIEVTSVPENGTVFIIELNK
ncbi:MAG: ATP-binding protein [Candidatus Gracilibacteria bacterium]